jgi:hypothetical protein
VGISRKRRVASDGFLYTRVGITAREDSVVYFIGLAILPDEIAAMFEPENDLVLHVGANRHRGMGRIHLWIESWEEPRHWHTAIERADHITSLLDSDSQEKYFTLDTLTPWVPDPFTSHTHPLEGLPAELVFSTTKAEVLTGWHQESGLPRRSYPGVMGTFLYRTSSSELISELHLAQLGLEQDRGYGLMMVCDPYHYERTEIS